MILNKFTSMWMTEWMKQLWTHERIKKKKYTKKPRTHKAISEWKDKRAKKASKQAVKQWR